MRNSIEKSVGNGIIKEKKNCICRLLWLIGRSGYMDSSVVSFRDWGLQRFCASETRLRYRRRGGLRRASWKIQVLMGIGLEQESSDGMLPNGARKSISHMNELERGVLYGVK